MIPNSILWVLLWLCIVGAVVAGVILAAILANNARTERQWEEARRGMEPKTFEECERQRELWRRIKQRIYCNQRRQRS